MPLYEYECDANGHRFELIRKFSDPPLDSCPQCGSPVHKLFSSPAIQFKGSGFYITDYAKSDSGGPPKSSGGKDPDSGGKGGSEKTDTAAKSDSTAAPASPSGDATKNAASKDTAKKEPPKKDPPKADAAKKDG